MMPYCIKKRSEHNDVIQDFLILLGPVVENPINANSRLKINEGVYFSTPKCCLTLIFCKTLHEKKLILKNKISKRNFHQKVEKMKVYTNLGLS